jgi:2-dehydrotetronate isomerase
MPKLAANLTWLFTELPFEERFGAAARHGFRAVEMLFPYELAPGCVAELLDTNELELVLFNLPPGDWAAGERGLTAHSGREAEIDAGVALARTFVQATGCRRVHAMAGLVPAGCDRASCEPSYVENLRRISRSLRDNGVTVLIEPLNVVENPTYHLQTTAAAVATIAAVAEPNLSLQLDLYHTQITEGDLERKIRALEGRFAHVQIAGNPHRNEPDTGEVDYHYILGVLDDAGYDGWIGCEYRPRTTTSAGLAWADRYLGR